MSSVPPAPETIGPFRVIRAIARGGMAEVFEVEDDRSGERIALKLLQAESAGPRFNREYEALARLNHPNIVRVYQYGFHGPQPWITMELVAGQPLQARMKSVGKAGTAVRQAEIVRTVALVADALEYIHGRGLLHRDLKSDNILVLTDGRVKLLDFGTAYVYDALDPITKDGEFVGTFAYAAPEQISGGARAVDHRADLYALGVLLYRLCTGVRPFDAEDPKELARLHAKVIPPSPRERVPDIPESLDRLVMHLLEKRPEDRPNSAGVVSKVLREIGDGGDPYGRLEMTAPPDAPIGREGEVRTATEELSTLETGGMLVVEGPAGSGAGSFLDAVCVAAQARGQSVVTVRVDPDDPSPALDELVEAICAPLVGKANPELLKKTLAIGGFDDARRIEALRKLAAAVAIERARHDRAPLLIAVHRLDVGSYLLNEVLVGIRKELRAGAPMVRFAASVSDSAGRDALFRQRFGNARRVSLATLSVRGVALTVGVLLGRRPPASDLARRVHEAAGGQPVYVAEVIRKLLQTRQLALKGLDGNRVDWASKEAQHVVPASEVASEIVAGKLRALPAITRRLLEVAAVAGGTARISEIASVLAADRPTLIRPAQQAAESGLCRLEPLEGDLALVLVHRLAMTVIEANCSRGRLMALRRGVVALGVVDRPAAGPARLRAMLGLGDVRGAARELPAIVDGLAANGAAGEACDLADEVVKRIDKPRDPEVYADAWHAHVRVGLVVRPADPMVAKSVARLSELHNATGADRARTVFAKARMASVIGHYSNYRKYLGEAWESAKTGDPALASQIATELVLSEAGSGHVRAATDWLERAEKLAIDSGVPSAPSLVGAAGAHIALMNGDLGTAEEAARDALVLADEARYDAGRFRAVIPLSTSLREQGRFTEALRELYSSLPKAREGDSASDLVSLLLATARIEIVMNRLGKAQECLDELDTSIRSGEFLHLRLDAKLLRGRILLASGLYLGAMGVLTDVHERARTADLPVISEIARGLLGEATFYAGKKDDAVVHLRNASLGLMGVGDQIALSEACVARARCVAETEDPNVHFGPVQTLLQDEKCLVLRLERGIAIARHIAAKGDRTGAFRAWREPAAVLNQLAPALDDIDRSALRIHPWSKRIRAGLKS